VTWAKLLKGPKQVSKAKARTIPNAYFRTTNNQSWYLSLVPYTHLSHRQHLTVVQTAIKSVSQSVSQLYSFGSVRLGRTVSLKVSSTKILQSVVKNCVPIANITAVECEIRPVLGPVFLKFQPPVRVSSSLH